MLEEEQKNDLVNLRSACETGQRNVHVWGTGWVPASCQFSHHNLFKGSHTGSARTAISPSTVTLLATAQKHTLTRLERQCLRRFIDRHHRHNDNEGSGERSSDGDIYDYTLARCSLSLVGRICLGFMFLTHLCRQRGRSYYEQQES